MPPAHRALASPDKEAADGPPSMASALMRLEALEGLKTPLALLTPESGRIERPWGVRGCRLTLLRIISSE
eukprot:10690884-Alexandrium_andersonii.AAC.1